MNDFSGTALLAKDGKPLFLKSYGKFELTPESETRLFSDTPDVTITFTAANGAASQLVLNLGGRNRIAKRVQ